MFTRFSTLSRIPKGVWVLGGVSMLIDISSEMIHSLLPLFMATTLGASVVIIGLIEGLAEATALMVKVFSGAISDYIGKRKGLALLGYGMGALSKPLFALATSSGMAFGARMIDRLGKGIRGAPRDALVADVTPAEIRGALSVYASRWILLARFSGRCWPSPFPATGSAGADPGGYRAGAQPALEHHAARHVQSD
ncbi:Major Facilitator Superfamily protein [Kosakonia sacchari]|nr:Major Facilitator Superfamily protein [Kosakonia sacchari]